MVSFRLAVAGMKNMLPLAADNASGPPASNPNICLQVHMSNSFLSMHLIKITTPAGGQDSDSKIIYLSVDGRKRQLWEAAIKNAPETHRRILTLLSLARLAGTYLIASSRISIPILEKSTDRVSDSRASSGL